MLSGMNRLHTIDKRVVLVSRRRSPMKLQFNRALLTTITVLFSATNWWSIRHARQSSDRSQGACGQRGWRAVMRTSQHLKLVLRAALALALLGLAGLAAQAQPTFETCVNGGPVICTCDGSTLANNPSPDCNVPGSSRVDCVGSCCKLFCGSCGPPTICSPNNNFQCDPNAPNACGSDECGPLECVRINSNPAFPTVTTSTECRSRCIPPPPDDKQPDICTVGGPQQIGDPFSADGEGSFSQVDVSVPGTLGAIKFERRFLTTPRGWLAQNSLGTPSGGQNVQTPFIPTPFGSRRGNSLQWWHNFYTFVAVRPGGGWSVRYPTGVIANFNACTPAPGSGCFASVAPDSQEVSHKLWWSPVGNTPSLTLYRPDGKYVYATIWLPNGAMPHFFLSRIESANYGASRPQATLAYTLPFSDCPGAMPSGTLYSGTPYLSAVTTADNAQLRFEYTHQPGDSNSKAPTECVLSRVLLNGIEVASYSYNQGTAGLLSQAQLTQRGLTQTYDYPGQAFTVSEKVTGSSRALPTLSLLVNIRNGSQEVYEQRTAVAGTLQPNWRLINGLQPGQPPGTVSLQQLSRYQGSGSNSAASPSYNNVMRSLSPSSTSGRSHRVAAAADSSGLVKRWLWDNMPGGLITTRAVRDANGSWRVYTVANANPSGGFSGAGFTTPFEVRSVKIGAVDDLGASALMVTDYTYAYGGQGRTPRAYEQLLETESKDSVLGGRGTKAITKYIYDQSTNRLKAIIRSGYTKKFDSNATWQPASQHFIATFYYDQPQQCTGGGSADPLGRVVEIHGPCLVSGAGNPNANPAVPPPTDCDMGGTIPVTRYEYFPHSGSFDSARLSAVVHYPNATLAACGTGILTEYSNYDAFGNPTVVTENARTTSSVTTTYTYSENRVTHRTVAGKSWNYFYDLGRLRAIQYPAGNFEVFCRRNLLPNGVCDSNSPPMKEVTARMTGTDSWGTGYSEAIRYDYGTDGHIRSIRYVAVNGTTRHTSFFQRDPNDNLTFEQDGFDGPAPSKLFDGVGNLRALSMPFALAPQDCGGLNSIDPRCAALGYDRANRLTTLDQAGVQGGPRTATSWFTYDKQGNIASTAMGCPPGSAPGTCNYPAAKYQWDDFGNVIEEAIPGFDTSGGSTLNPTYIEYDAMGNRVKKQTVGMRSPTPGRVLEWVYDGAGRIKSEKSWLGSTLAKELYTTSWDTGARLPARCDWLLPKNPNTNGRVASETDPVWTTWYGYDAEGRLTNELRVRQQMDCRTANADNFLITQYSYDQNGNLNGIMYPHGRTVRYGYGTQANANRVTGVTVSLWDGVNWQNQTVVTNVQWEPYGGLRSYTIQNPINGASRNIEYFLSGDVTTPATCSASAPQLGTDPSSRLRALFVSANGSAGDTYKRFYTWNKEQIAAIDTCYLGNANAQHEDFTYDSQGRLLTANMPNFATTGGSYSTRTYTYDSRGNRTDMVIGTWAPPFMNVYRSDFHSSSYPMMVDNLASQYAGAPWPLNTGIYSHYEYVDGNVSARDRRPDSAGGNWSHRLTFDYGESSNTGAFGHESVFRRVGVEKPSIRGFYYNYAYDSHRRRTQKEYPYPGVTDEFFWSPNKLLLEDRGSNPIYSIFYDKLSGDDYIWLGGRPIMVVRGGFSRNFAAGTVSRLVDNAGTCARNDEATPCGMYFIVTDHLLRPVLALDRNMKITGTGEYDPFGRPNAVEWWNESAHPYGSGVIPSTFWQMSQPSFGMNTDFRAHFTMLDTEQDSRGNVREGPSLWDGTTGAWLETLGGYQKGDTYSRWHTISTNNNNAKVFQLGWGTVNGNCAPSSPRCRPFDNWPYAGYAMDRYEYRRYESGTTPFFPPLRAAGQYWDQETDLFENWYRYYDPATGRYLAPEPALQFPNFAQDLAAAGLQTPSHAFANNNPIYFVDWNGFGAKPLPLPAGSGGWAPVVIEGGKGTSTGSALGPLGGFALGFWVGFEIAQATGGHDAMPDWYPCLNCGPEPGPSPSPSSSPQSVPPPITDSRNRVRPGQQRPIFPGQVCSSDPLTEMQQKCVQQAKNKTRLLSEVQVEKNFRMAMEYCICMGALDALTCQEELAKIGWGEYMRY